MTKIDYSKLFSYITRGANGEMGEMDGKMEEETRREVERWRQADAEHEAFFRRVREYYRKEPTRNRRFSAEELEELFAETWRECRRRKRLRVTRWAAAAASVAAIVVAGLWWTGGGTRELPATVAEVRTVDPSEVMIVTESGERLATSQLPSEVARQAGWDKLEYTGGEMEGEGEMEREMETREGVRDGKEGRDSARVERVPMHRMVVPRGRTFDLVLADGTLVMLQPESELTYPVRFDSTRTREVTLRGEAFFEVTKSGQRFAVNGERSRVEVYGTVFNLRSRAGEADETVLLEGRVGVRPIEEGKMGETREMDGEMFLRPGERSTVDSTGGVTVTKADVAEYVARRNGYNLFNGKTIGEILNVLERYYDVTFTGKAMAGDERLYVLSVKQTAPLREALDAVEAIAEVEFEIEGKEVRVKKMP